MSEAQKAEDWIEVARDLTGTPVKPTCVRVGKPTDTEAVYWLCHRLFNENFMGLPFSEKKVAGIVSRLCRGDGGIVGIIDSPDGTIAGSIGICATQPVYTETWILSEVWNYVTPEHRIGSENGNDLFRFALWHRADMAARVGYDIPLETSVYSFDRIAAKTRLWGRYGKHVGSHFWTGGGVK